MPMAELFKPTEIFGILAIIFIFRSKNNSECCFQDLVLQYFFIGYKALLTTYEITPGEKFLSKFSNNMFRPYFYLNTSPNIIENHIF